MTIVDTKNSIEEDSQTGIGVRLVEETFLRKSIKRNAFKQKDGLSQKTSDHPTAQTRSFSPIFART